MYKSGTRKLHYMRIAHIFSAIVLDSKIEQILQ